MNGCSRVRYRCPPWLLFIAENGIGKRVPLNAFRQSRFNVVGLVGYKVWLAFAHQFISVLTMSAFDLKTYYNDAWYATYFLAHVH